MCGCSRAGVSSQLRSGRDLSYAIVRGSRHRQRRGMPPHNLYLIDVHRLQLLAGELVW
jgi:hypothetical protein